jgi:cell division protein FtsB
MKFKNIINIILERNFLIIFTSVIIFSVTFFSKKGILRTAYQYKEEKKNNKKYLQHLQKKINTLSKMISLMKEGNREIIEMINHDYKNIVPYENYITFEEKKK